MNGGSKSDIVDLKDVELTLLPSYLHEPTDSENQANAAMVDLLNYSQSSQVVSSRSNQDSISPPQRPPRLHGYQGKINVGKLCTYGRASLWSWGS